MSTFRFEEQKSLSLRHRVADNVRHAILSGNLKSGDRLREQEIAEQMKVSRGPIREAFSLLEREGLVENYPYKETLVATMSKEEITEILLPIRFTLEAFALKKALPQLTEDDFTYLTTIVEKMDLAANDGDLVTLVDLDVEFHRFLIQKSEQRTALQLWQGIDMRIRLHFMSHGKEYVDLQEIPREHRQLLDALKTKDLDAVLNEFRRHVVELNQ